ncbi:PspA/IM30 family protein [Parageobacillus thermoglucosidasius]|uniref:PspA/IM30 family protein n=1 Tax=Parageobacillus thermoglucosidasius TaxID=1426 RepID=UPI0001D1785D|nr:PspA/IM30 family protein [Parageobacillus thermoglucosidasius]AEH49713.1 phage shock protein A, PspA [Parageobacillus thermoglucosidasius C56-YS93]
MADLLTRIKNIIMADLHEMIDQKEKQNPIALLNEYLRQCEKEVEKVRHLLERQHLLKTELMREYNQAKELADKRKYQAQIASQAGENELYEFAVSEQTKYEERASRIQELLQEATNELEQLERKYEEMKHKLKDMYIRRMQLMGRENVARAHYRMDKVLQAGWSDVAYPRFHEMEQYLERLEQNVKANYYASTIDARIAQLEKKLETEKKNAIS